MISFESGSDEERLNDLSVRLYRFIDRHATAVHNNPKIAEDHFPRKGSHSLFFYSRINRSPVIVSMGQMRKAGGRKYVSIVDNGTEGSNNSAVGIEVWQNTDGRLPANASNGPEQVGYG